MRFSDLSGLPHQHLFFDFDGVILDSVSIKSQAYRAIFEKYGSHAVDLIEDYHIKNGGISRDIKIRHVLEQLIKGGVFIADLDQENQCMIDHFTRLVDDWIHECDFIPGVLDFIDRQKKRNRSLFIVSGTPEAELLQIVANRKISSYFKEVRGSPALKPLIIEDILKKYNLNRSDSVMFGDSATDFDAAQKTGMLFIGLPESRFVHLES